MKVTYSQNPIRCSRVIACGFRVTMGWHICRMTWHFPARGQSYILIAPAVASEEFLCAQRRKVNPPSPSLPYLPSSRTRTLADDMHRGSEAGTLGVLACVLLSTVATPP